MLREHYIETLFQMGYTQVAGLADLARSTVRSEAIEILDSPWREMMEGLHRKRPLTYRPRGEPESEGFGDFGELAEVRACLEAVERVRLWLDLFRPSAVSGAANGSAPDWIDPTRRILSFPVPRYSRSGSACGQIRGGLSSVFAGAAQ